MAFSNVWRARQRLTDGLTGTTCNHCGHEDHRAGACHRCNCGDDEIVGRERGHYFQRVLDRPTQIRTDTGRLIGATKPDY